MLVRTRFAPSPTGAIHLGNARTAIFSYLLAQSLGGKVFIRIEDTDMQRSSEEYEKQLRENLHWLGLHFDNTSDIRQSERLTIYNQWAEQLVEQEKAFYCFCTEEMLQKKKDQLILEKKPPHYDGTCRSLSLDQINEYKSQYPYTIRFKTQKQDVQFNDFIKGSITIKKGMFGDFVILRASKVPVYNFAAVVDDILMEITHIIRGEEHLSNTARQILLYQAFDKPIPQFGHTALILASDGAKLSKRHGSTSIEEYKNLGYLPEALFNYLALLGFSPQTLEEKLSKEQLISYFDVSRINRSGAKFDRKKLNWINKLYLKEQGEGVFHQQLIQKVQEKYPEHTYSKEELSRIVILGFEGCHYLNEIFEYIDFFFEFNPSQGDQKYQSETYVLMKQELMDQIQQYQELHLSFSHIETLFDLLSQKFNVKGKNLFMPIRMWITGKNFGVDLPSIMNILHTQEIINRLNL